MVRILIDMQACQTESRYRGIGRYTTALVEAMVEQRGSDEIHVLLNSAFPENLSFVRKRYYDLVGVNNVHVFDALPQSGSNDPKNGWRNDASALLREVYIEYIAPDVIFCPSFFEGFLDDAILTVARFSSIPVIVTLHDLIPLIYKQNYLQGNMAFQEGYLSKLEEIKQCSGLLTISESASSEAEELLGFSRDLLVNTSEAADSKFCKTAFSKTEKQHLLKKFSLKQPYVFYTGGTDFRKNLPRLIEAFSSLPAELLDRHQLVFAGSMPEADRLTLMHLAQKYGVDKNTKIIGYVSDEDLISLYNMAEAFVFPSLHEGFGLPALEAMQCGTPVIASNTSSIPEVVEMDEALFDPTSVKNIAEKIERVLTDKAFKNRLVTFGNKQAMKFSWEISARKALEGIRGFVHYKKPLRHQWPVMMDIYDDLDERLIEAVVMLPGTKYGPTKEDLMRFSQAMANNRLSAESKIRPTEFRELVSWRMEGPFDSSYSLALVNRELAHALEADGHEVSLMSSEGDGDFLPDEIFLNANPDLKAMYDRALSQNMGQPTLISRNMYPPRVTDMRGKANALHNYAWEETGFPARDVAAFNESLQFMTVTSQHVKKIMIDNGVSIPIEVVGNGVDHWNRITADKNYSIQNARHRFLHVSSCFPRKGVDVLLESYGEAFTSDDDVLLVIKTFANPHNRVEPELQEVRSRHPKYPSVLIIMDDISDEQLKALYQQCDTLVAPSRAEGFGLPIAEAMLSGLDIITTGWSGQLDFCSPQNAKLIDFTYMAAETHEGMYDSVWAEPDPKHLSRLLQEVYQKKNAPDGENNSSIAALLDTHSWKAVAKRNVSAARKYISSPCHREPSVGWISTYKKRCGIATYSEHLLNVLGMPVTVLADYTSEAVSRDTENIIRCWREGDTDTLDELMEHIIRLDLDLVVIQFNFGFFNFASFNRFLNTLADRGCKIIIILHSTADPANVPEKKLSILVPGLSRCTRLLVHSINDLNRLKALGFTQNTALFPHGVPEKARPKILSRTLMTRISKTIRIAAYGFFLPNKGLIELIQALALLCKKGENYKLDLVNAEYPVEISSELIKEARALVRSLKLSSRVTFYTEFLKDEESLKLLSNADMIIYPYQKTGESVSGAVRYGLISGIPVAVTPLPIFDDIADIVYKLPGTSPATIATGIQDLSQKIAINDPSIETQKVRAKAWCKAHSYPLLGQRLRGMLQGIFKDRAARDF